MAARALVWTTIAVLVVRRRLRRAGGISAPVPPPWRASPRGSLGLRLAIRLTRATCLERSLVVQRWWSAQGEQRVLLLGVGHDDAGAVLAHAWLEGEELPPDRTYEVIASVPAP